MRISKYASSASPILSYIYGEDWITIEGVNGYTHTFRYKDTGKRNVDRMIRYAKKGKGLSRFIIKHQNTFKPDNKNRFFGLSIKAFSNLLDIKIYFPLMKMRNNFISIIKKRVVIEVNANQSNHHHIAPLSFSNAPQNKRVITVFEDKNLTK